MLVIASYFFTVLFLIAGSDSLSDRLVPGSLFLFSLVYLLVHFSEKFQRTVYSYYEINNKGIANKIILRPSKDIFMSWSEVKDIVFHVETFGSGTTSQVATMYFCSMDLEQFDATYLTKSVPLGSRPLDNQAPTRQTDYMFPIPCTKELVSEVLKHVPKESIKNLDKLPANFV